MFNAEKIDIFGGLRADLPEFGIEDLEFFPKWEESAKRSRSTILS